MSKSSLFPGLRVWAWVKMTKYIDGAEFVNVGDVHTNNYENLPIQYTETFSSEAKIGYFVEKKNIFDIFAQNIDCGYTLELPRPGGSNEDLQSMF